MSKLLNRKLEVNVGGKSYHYPDLNIAFDIPHTVKPEPDVAEIKIYNISDDSVGTIKTGADIIVNGGYGDDVGTIFTGKVDQVLPTWSGTTKEVTILATTIGSSFRNKKINKTYKSGVTADFIIRDLARMIGLSIGELSPVRNIRYPKGKVISGNIYSNISKIAAETQSKMYTQGRQIFIRPDKSSTKSGVVLDSTSGLIGSPVREEKEETPEGSDKSINVVEYKITSLLNHTVQKDTWVRVNSRDLKGDFRVREVRHSDFKTEITVRP